MFQGTIPPQLRSMILEASHNWAPGTDVYVACSGNFTIERTLASQDLRLHSNDVSIYTSAIGRWLTHKPVGITLNPDMPDYAWSGEYLDDAAGSVATIMLFTNISAYIGKDNRYYRRQIDAYRAQWPQLIEKTVERLSNLTLKIEDYTEGDFRDYLRAAPEEAPIITFPPFYGGGYEKLYAGIEKVFDWQPPKYREFEPGAEDEFFEFIQHRPEWIIATNLERPELEADLRGYIKPSTAAAPFWVYSRSRAHTRVARPQQRTAPVKYQRLTPNDKMGDLTIKPITSAEYESLRLLYLDPKINTTINASAIPYGVFSGGYLIGVIAYKAQQGAARVAYLLTDFAIDGTGRKRISKLVAEAATSQEAITHLEQSYASKYTTVRTTVFSDHPVSMKYRGIYTLTKREEQEPDQPHKYKLIYETQAGTKTLTQINKEWNTKHGDK